MGLVPAGVEHEELSQLARKHTAAIPAVTARKLSRPDNRAALAPVPEAGLEVARPPVRERRQTPARPQLSAVERSRLKREAREGIGGLIKLWWIESSAIGRALVYLGGVATVAGALALVWWAVLRDGQKGPNIPEPTELSSAPVEYSFGLGEGVDFENSDQKAFSFTYVAATRAVVILHFQSSDISAGEVLVSVNGEEVGQLPPDPINPTEVTHELILPPERLKKAEFNQVVFDNVRNPPGQETWRVWNVRMEIAPLPEQPPSELLRDARADYDRGIKDLERKNIGARNRYDAWRNFRSAWLRLEAHPAAQARALRALADQGPRGAAGAGCHLRPAPPRGRARVQPEGLRRGDGHPGPRAGVLPQQRSVLSLARPPQAPGAGSLASGPAPACRASPGDRSDPERGAPAQRVQPRAR